MKNRPAEQSLSKLGLVETTLGMPNSHCTQDTVGWCANFMLPRWLFGRWLAGVVDGGLAISRKLLWQRAPWWDSHLDPGGHMRQLLSVLVVVAGELFQHLLSLCVTLDKLCQVSKPWFPHLKYDEKSICETGLL